MLGAVEYYEKHATEFAVQASNPELNSFEYAKNMPILLEQTDAISGNVLDFGCGAGNFTQALVRTGRLVDGCDTSPSLLQYASIHSRDVHDLFIWDGLSTLPKKTKYNLILAKLVFHYIPQLDEVLGNLSEVLDTDDFLCFSVPHPRKTAMLAGTDENEAVFLDEVGNFGLKLEMIHRSEQRYVQLLGDVGLAVINERTVSVSDRPKRLNILATKL